MTELYAEVVPGGQPGDLVFEAVLAGEAPLEITFSEALRGRIKAVQSADARNRFVPISDPRIAEIARVLKDRKEAGTGMTRDDLSKLAGIDKWT